MSGRLRDPHRSAAVIAGVFHQTSGSDLLNLPAVENNVRDLARALRDPGIWGLPGERCVELPQPTREQFLSAVGEAGATATDTLFVYFAGHGIVHPATDRLYLALPDFNSEGEFGTKAIRYADLQDLLWEPRVKARHKVIVLDTCFSARAFDDSMGGRNAVYDMLRTRGACTLVSSDVTETSRAPQGTDYTAYTARVISTLRHGIEDEEETLTLQAVHGHIRERLRSANISTPRILGADDTPLIRIARNRAFDGGSTEPGGTSTPSPGEQWQDFQDELFRLLKAELGTGRADVRVEYSLPWDVRLGPRQEGERLLALFEHRTLLAHRFTAFTTKAVKFRHSGNGDSVAQVAYTDLHRWSVKIDQVKSLWHDFREARADWYGRPAYARPTLKYDVLLTCDETTFYVPHGEVGDYPLRNLLAKVRDLTRKYDLDLPE
ncbi:caspase family protein [Streptomyces griseiscabiei]|uniref:Caspase family protein n=1 Tax=Streptomyces griseiscabiei TaxID=2993540 RepID=A0ABU4KWB7_9ACTN|nr:caspase family protein [Streptomyces griseiscabiei]MBZ3903356.1 caspase family protein [Streptomyces griseiscabiei]MDX2907667.1 caspase family protein [Streptomyces griseiscabiei]